MGPSPIVNTNNHLVCGKFQAAPLLWPTRRAHPGATPLLQYPFRPPLYCSIHSGHPSIAVPIQATYPLLQYPFRPPLYCSTHSGHPSIAVPIQATPLLQYPFRPPLYCSTHAFRPPLYCSTHSGHPFIVVNLALRPTPLLDPQAVFWAEELNCWSLHENHCSLVVGTWCEHLQSCSRERKFLEHPTASRNGDLANYLISFRIK